MGSLNYLLQLHVNLQSFQNKKFKLERGGNEGQKNSRNRPKQALYNISGCNRTYIKHQPILWNYSLAGTEVWMSNRKEQIVQRTCHVKAQVSNSPPPHQRKRTQLMEKWSKAMEDNKRPKGTNKNLSLTLKSSSLVFLLKMTVLI